MIGNILSRTRHRGWCYRLAIPAAALFVFALFALLEGAGLRSAGLSVLRFLGLDPGPFPFLDTHAVLAAAECHRLGYEVFLAVPCDVYGRVHVYSPLWLPLVPWGTAATAWVGAGLVLLCILVLPLLLRPRNGSELGLFALAVFSPATLYAFERANNDLVIFLVAVCVGLLLEASRRWRLCAYALIVLAALLKYYPAVLLAMVARERRREAVLCLGAAGAVLILFVAYYHDVLGQALSNIPRHDGEPGLVVSYYADSFSARNLPFGLAKALQLDSPLPFAMGLFAVLAYFALARTRRTVRLLDRFEVDWDGREMRFAAIGALLLTACFFAAQNVNYRGIYFLMVLPALLRLRDGAAADARAGRWLSLMIAAVLFLMWNEFFRRALVDGFLALPGGLGDRLAAVFWVLREFLWWWLVAGLAALAASHLLRLPLVEQSALRIGRCWPAFDRILAARFKAHLSAGD